MQEIRKRGLWGFVLAAYRGLLLEENRDDSEIIGGIGVN